MRVRDEDPISVQAGERRGSLERIRSKNPLMCSVQSNHNTEKLFTYNELLAYNILPDFFIVDRVDLHLGNRLDNVIELVTRVRRCEEALLLLLLADNV